MHSAAPIDKPWAGWLAALAVAVGTALALTGCGGSSSKTSSTKAPARHAVVNHRVRVPAAAQLATAARKPNGESVLAKIHAPRATGSRPTPHLAGFDESSVAVFTHEVDASVGAFWQSGLNQLGYTYSPAKEDLITQTGPGVKSACSGGTAWTVNTLNAAYCAADNTFYLPIGFLSLIGHNFGDAAVAVTIAHENGHHVQALLGITQRYWAGQYKTIQMELQADCLAGVWMSSEYQRNDIQPGDLQKALLLYNDMFGDPTGMSPTDPQAHGTGAERWAAFSQGYNSGQGGKCEIPALPAS